MPHCIDDHTCRVKRTPLRIAKVTIREHAVRDVKIIRTDCGNDVCNGTRSKRNLLRLSITCFLGRYSSTYCVDMRPQEGVICRARLTVDVPECRLELVSQIFNMLSHGTYLRALHASYRLRTCSSCNVRRSYLGSGPQS